VRLSTSLRSSSALWAAPFVLGVVIFYYVVATQETVSEQDFGYAPTLVSAALLPMYAFAYAVPASLAVWESGRLAKGAVWHLAPARSRFRVALGVLAPVIGLAWLMPLSSVGLALAQGGALPTPESLLPLLLAMLLCVAHAVIGFAVGRHLPRVVAAPLLGALVWIVVATSWTNQVFWWRHILGQYPEQLGFGETATASSILAHLLPATGLAAAVALLWSPIRQLVLRLLLATALTVACGTGAYALTADWGPRAPVSVSATRMACAGTAPRVCMPESTAGDLPAVQAEVVESLDELSVAGVLTQPPAIVTDTLGADESPRTSDQETWRVALTSGEREGHVGYLIVRAAVRFPCEWPEPFTSRLVLLWAAEKTGEVPVLDQLLAEDPFYGVEQRDRLRDTLAEVLASTPAEQARWYHESLEDGCGGDA
jgi:hypothetical protein